MKKIDFVIIGGQKSGSTFIQEVIAEHPQIYMPGGEVTFLEDPDYQQDGLCKLRQLFEHQDENKNWGIKRPSLLGCAECPERIYRDLDNPKLVVILRNPIDRAISAYFHYIHGGFLPPVDLEEGMKNLLKGKLKYEYPRSIEILEFGFYYKLLSNFLNFFTKDRILMLIHEDLKQDKEAMIREVYRFLEVDEHFIPVKSMDTTPQKVVYSLPRQRFRRLSNPLKWRYNENRTRLMRKKQNLLEKGVCYLTNGVDKVILSKIYNGNKPFISPQLRQTLYDVYKEDIRQLEGLLGIDLSRWKWQEEIMTPNYLTGEPLKKE